MAMAIPLGDSIHHTLYLSIPEGKWIFPIRVFLLLTMTSSFCDRWKCWSGHSTIFETVNHLRTVVPFSFLVWRLHQTAPLTSYRLSPPFSITICSHGRGNNSQRLWSRSPLKVYLVTTVTLINNSLCIIRLPLLGTFSIEWKNSSLKTRPVV